MGFERQPPGPPSRADILRLAQEVVDYKVRFTPGIALELARFVLMEQREREAAEVAEKAASVKS